MHEHSRGDIRISPAADGDFAICDCTSGDVLSSHRDLLDAVIACHALANAYNINVWQEVDNESNLLPEPRRLYSRVTDTQSPA